MYWISHVETTLAFISSFRFNLWKLVSVLVYVVLKQITGHYSLSMQQNKDRLTIEPWQTKQNKTPQIEERLRSVDK